MVSPMEVIRIPGQEFLASEALEEAVVAVAEMVVEAAVVMAAAVAVDAVVDLVHQAWILEWDRKGTTFLWQKAKSKLLPSSTVFSRCTPMATDS